MILVHPHRRAGNGAAAVDAPRESAPTGPQPAPAADGTAAAGAALVAASPEAIGDADPLDDGSIEFASVNVHEDMTIPD